MANLVAGDVVQCRFIHAGPTGEEAFVIMNYVIGTITGGTIADQDFADQASMFYSSLIVTIMPSTCYYDGVIVSLPARSPQPASVKSNLGNGSGSSGSQVANTQATALISLPSGLSGQKNRGRSYLPFVTATFIGTDGFPTSGFQTLLLTIAAAFAAFQGFTVGGASATFNQVIYHAALKIWTYVYLWVAKRRFATQRRRGNYGKNRTPPI